MEGTVLATPAAAPAAAPAAPAGTPAAPAAAPVAPVAAAVAPNPSVPASFIGDGGTLHFQHAAGYLPKDLHGAIDGFQARFEGKNVGDVLKSYSELEREFSTLKGSRAVPEKPTLDAYGIAKPEGLSDELWKGDAPKVEKFVAIAHELGIGKDEFSKLYGAYAETLVADHTAAATAKREAQQASVDTLVKAWGNEFNPNRETAYQHVLTQFAEMGIDANSPEAITLFDNPAFIQFAHHQARKLGEGSTVLPPGAIPVTLSDGEKARDIMINPANPLHEKFIAESKAGKGPTLDYVEKLRSKVKPPRPGA